MEMHCVGLHFSSLVLQSPSPKGTRQFLPSSQLPNPFRGRNHSLPHHSILNTCSVRSPRKPISSGWDLGRFLKTLYFFNGPPSPAKFFESLIEKLSGPSPSKPVKEMETSGFVLVAGATGGVGRRVVDILRNKGLPVRVLVRNEEKAKKMLGPDIDLVRLITSC